MLEIRILYKGLSPIILNRTETPNNTCAMRNRCSNTVDLIFEMRFMEERFQYFKYMIYPRMQSDGRCVPATGGLDVETPSSDPTVAGKNRSSKFEVRRSDI